MTTTPNTSATVAPATVETKLIPVGEIFAVDSKNPRGGVHPKTSDPRSFADLKDSIEAFGGLLQPVLVVADTSQKGAKYRVIAGYRRFHAVSELHKENAARFPTISATVVPSTAITLADDPTEEHPEGSSHTLTAKDGELFIAATENSVRQDPSLWDRIALCGKFLGAGYTLSDATLALAENGHKLSVQSIRNYGKIAGFPAKVLAKLKPMQGGGYTIAVKLSAKEYNDGTVEAPRWNAQKQLDAIAALASEKEEKEKEKKEGEGKGKKSRPARFAATPAEIEGRWKEIEACASSDVIAALGWLIGKITREQLVKETDSDFACALTGEGGPDTVGETPPAEKSGKAPTAPAKDK